MNEGSKGDRGRCQHPRRRRGRRRPGCPSELSTDEAPCLGEPLPNEELYSPKGPRLYRNNCGRRRRKRSLSTILFPVLLLAAAGCVLLLPLAPTAEAAPSPAAYPAKSDEGENSDARAEDDSTIPENASATASNSDTETLANADVPEKERKIEDDGRPSNYIINGVGLNVGRAPASPTSTTPVIPREETIIQKKPKGNVPTRSQPLILEEEEEAQQRKLEMEEDFMEWCKQVMGIETSLEIKYFDYPVDFLQGWDECDDYDEFGYEDGTFPSEKQPEMVQVRGLSATRDIEVGDVVISIPLNAMVTIKTTVDHDPVLSRVLGPESRAKYGWDSADNAADYEIPILIAAVLYHRALGRRSPLASYMHVLESAPVDSMPFLWDRRRLRTEVGEGVRRAVRDVRADIRDMYDAIIQVLVRDHPAVFGRKGKNATDISVSDDDWVYSHKNFQWAFAMVNSRHWHVPVVDLDDEAPRAKKGQPTANIDGSDRPPTKVLSSVASEMPPAEQPTDEYVQQQEGLQSTASVGDSASNGGDSVDQDSAGSATEDAEEDAEEDVMQASHGIRRHSFLAPLADLLNFGPPCTRGVYDPVSHRFEIVATCTFRPGQEVTFYYSDDCTDVIFANYGFIHPLVPKCLTVDEYRSRADAWRDYAERLEGALEETYQEVDRLEGEVSELHARIRECGGCGSNPTASSGAGVAREKKGAGQPQPTAKQQQERERERMQQELERSAPPAPPRRTLRTDHRHGDPDHADGIRGGSGDGEVGDDRRETEGHGGIRRIWFRPKSDRGL